ncbi:Mif2/CENP-C like-domain-containing protein [Boletus coccyginus]|nr:Mif2/CENP-C like-domain-containing protein [Boletus coccyginus]
MPREPTDRRKSSLGTRRGPPRQHIPFRADDLARGKKTGMAVAYVDRNSDEFEPFEQVIKQADNRTPPRIKSKKKRVSIAPPVEEVDEDGEMSMDLAESNQGSPLAYFTNTNPMYTADSSRRPITSRSLMRASEIDYDQIPSPRSYPSVRPSATDGRGPSALSKSFSAREPTPDPDFDYASPDPGTFDDFELPQPDDDPPRLPTPEASPEDAVEDEEDAEAEQVVVAQSRKVDKGKRRADPVEEDVNGVEDDIARGLEDVENDENNAPLPKKPRREQAKPPKPRPEKRVIKPPIEHSPSPDGVRRGQRHRYKPLEWWRQERVVYGRRDSDLILVPQIKEIIRIPQEPIKPLGKAGKHRRGARTRSKSKGRDTPFNPEEGWDEDTPTNATVIDYSTQQEISRRVAFLASMIEPNQAANSNWFFQKIFGEGEFIAAGQMHIPPKSQKPSKSTKDNTYVFYVIQGAVSVFIHETSFIITTGGMFLVPRGNTYYIENIAERDAKLFFTQARMLQAEDMMQVQHTAQSAPPSSHRRAISEDVSAGPRKGTQKA